MWSRYLEEYYENLTRAIDLVTDTIDRNFAKRVVLSTVGNVCLLSTLTH